MKETELRKFSTCNLCGQKIGHTGLPLFWRVTVERFGLQIDAIKRQDGLTAILGGNAFLAMHMGVNDAVDSLLRARDKHVYLEGVHPQSTLIGVVSSHHGLSVDFFYSHESYPEVEDAVVPPALVPTFTRGESQHWISVDAQLPPTDKNVLACYMKKLGKYRIVLAFYVSSLHMEADEGVDEGLLEWGDNGCSYVKQGWYEANQAGSVFYPIEEPPTHWMNLPKPPVPPALPTIEYR